MHDRKIEPEEKIRIFLAIVIKIAIFPQHLSKTWFHIKGILTTKPNTTKLEKSLGEKQTEDIKFFKIRVAGAQLLFPLQSKFQILIAALLQNPHCCLQICSVKRQLIKPKADLDSLFDVIKAEHNQ